MAEKDYTAQNEAVIRKWEREEERRRARKDASEEKFKEAVVSSLRQDKVRRNVVNEVKEAINDPSRANNPRFAQAQSGITPVDDDEVITGFDRPWERAED
jgi:hypothetical protein